MTNIKSQHRQFVNSIVTKLQKNEYNATKSYLEVYPNTTSDNARVNASQLLNRPEVKSDLTVKLNNAGLDINTLNADLKVLTKARKVVVTPAGLITTPDNAIGLEGVKTAYKLHGVLSGNDKGTTYNDNRQVNIALDAQSAKGFADAVARLEALSATSKADLQSGEVAEAETLED